MSWTPKDAEYAREARLEIELAEKFPREAYELEAAEDALMHCPRRSWKRKHCEDRLARARERWTEVTKGAA